MVFTYVCEMYENSLFSFSDLFAALVLFAVFIKACGVLHDSLILRRLSVVFYPLQPGHERTFESAWWPH